MISIISFLKSLQYLSIFVRSNITSITIEFINDLYIRLNTLNYNKFYITIYIEVIINRKARLFVRWIEEKFLN